MTDRDHFAAAALTGLIANGDYSIESTPILAYRMADAMLRERGVTEEPMPKEKQAEVSFRIDGVDHPVPYSRSDEKRVDSPAIRDTTQPRNGTPAEGSVQGVGSVLDSRNAKEPVAWAVVGDGYEYVSLLRESAAEAARSGGGVMVPLYRRGAGGGEVGSQRGRKRAAPGR